MTLTRCHAHTRDLRRKKVKNAQEKEILPLIAKELVKKRYPKKKGLIGELNQL